MTRKIVPGEILPAPGEIVLNQGRDSVTVMVAEMIKLASFQLLEEGELGPKGIMELSRALSGAVSAQRGSEEYRRRLEQRVAAQINEAADRVEEVAREAGLSGERAMEMRRAYLGVRSKPAKPTEGGNGDA